MRKTILGVFLLSFIMTQDSFSGYLKSTEVSFCMDDCSQYYIESELDSDESYFVVFNEEEIDIEMYFGRFVEVVVSDQEINCIECSAFEVLEIALSQECEFPVNCFVDPCDVAQECELNTPVDCVSNYCGGCYADFYDLDGNLVDCYGDDEPGPNPCSDFGQEDCEWFDECVWTDSGCQDANEEDECAELSQDECEGSDDCEWISNSDNPNSWGMCVEVDNQDGLPECLLDCEGIEEINPEEDPYGACDWIVSTLGFDPGFASCFNDCDEEFIIEIYEVIEACYNCLEDSTLDCADVFGDDNDWECSDLGYEECMWYDNCEWISDSDNPNSNGYCMDAEQSDGCFSDEGEWYCIGCELFINDCQFYDCTEEGWSELITLDTDECNDEWSCSDINNAEDCEWHDDCEWQLNPIGTGQCVESDVVEPLCEDLSDYLFGPCDMIIGIGWNGEECTWYSGCGTIDEDGVDHSDSFFDSIEECEAICSDDQQGNGVLYGTVEYIWGDAIELVAGALVQITSTNMLYVTETNGQGFYEIELPQGEYTVNVEAYGEYQVQNIYIMANHEYELNFTFGEFYYETALTGNVSCGNCPNDYAPISNAHIVISNPNQWFNIETSTDEEGFFWASLPASGMYYVSISADGYMSFNDYVYVQGITDMSFYLDTDNSGGDGYAMLSLGDVAASAGMEVEVPLFLESDLAVAGVQFSVNYNSVTGSYLYPSGFNSTDDCFTASFNDLDGEFIGIIFSLEGCAYEPYDEGLHIADLVFEVTDNVPPGFESFLSFNSTLVSDIEGNEIISYGEGASILFGSLGDVNSDGDLNILDIVLIVNFAIYIEEPSDSQFWAADINEDGMINILDIVQVVNMILDN